MAKGWSVEELAAKAGRSPKTVQGVESGADCYVSTLKDVADALGVECIAIQKGDAPPPIKTGQAVCTVEIKIKTDFGNFDETTQLVEFLKVLLKLAHTRGKPVTFQSLVDIAVDDLMNKIDVKEVKDGSTTIVLEMPTDVYAIIRDAYRDGLLGELEIFDLSYDLRVTPYKSAKLDSNEIKAAEEKPATGDES